MNGEWTDGTCIDGIEASGAGGDRVEEGGEEAGTIDRALVEYELTEVDESGAAKDEEGGDCQDEAGMNAKAGAEVRGIPQAVGLLT